MTTRLPFTSTLSRVSLLERDMFATGALCSDPPLRFAAARALPQRPPAPPAASPPRPYPSTIGPRCPPRVAIGRAACPSAACPPPREAGLRQERRSRPARSRRRAAQPRAEPPRPVWGVRVPTGPCWSGRTSGSWEPVRDPAAS